MKIAFLGDIMPGGVLHYSDSKFIEDDVASFLAGFELRIATLECAIGDDFEYYVSKLDKQGRDKNIVYAKTKDIQRLKQLNIDIVTIANNHIFDLGSEGLANTIRVLEANGILFCGAGPDLERASRPVVIERKGKKIAFIGCAEVIPSSPHPAGPNQPGFNPLYIKKILEDIRKARVSNDLVFVLPHWGEEHLTFPPVRCKYFAMQMVDAGADGVFGGHSHSVQPTITYQGKPIFFSMGNFLFPKRFVHPPGATYYPEQYLDPESIPESGTAFCKSVSIKTWRPNALIGMVAELDLKEISKISFKLTRLSKDNVIEFFSHEDLLDKLKLVAFLVGLPSPFDKISQSIIQVQRKSKRFQKRVKNKIRRLTKPKVGSTNGEQ